MSLHLEFTPHSWYMDFAIKKWDLSGLSAEDKSQATKWTGYHLNGMTGYIVERNADTLKELKRKIKQYTSAEREMVERLYNEQRG